MQAEREGERGDSRVRARDNDKGRFIMKEFKCSYLGYKDSWKHVAHTEDLLLDVVALHLREVHNMNELPPEMLAKIKNSFTTPSSRDAAAAADLILREYNCDMEPECTWRYIAQTEDLIAEGAAAHAREKHGMHEFSEEQAVKVKKATHPYKKKKAA
jgi:predicted small metal-binding protein